MAERTSRVPAAEAVDGRPYRPSWFDLLSDTLRRSPVPSGIFYLLLFLVFAVGREVVGWSDGSIPLGSIYFGYVIDAVNAVFPFLACHMLDDLASRSFVGYRKVITGGDPVADGLFYRLTTLPARSTLILCLLGLILGAAYIPFFLSPHDRADALYFTSTQAVVADTFLSSVQTIGSALFAWHTVHQLLWISRIYSRHTEVSILHIGPLYSLSRVTAMTAVTLVVFSYLFAGWDIGSLPNVVWAASLLVLAALAFVVPLYGAHALLVAEKSHRLGEVSRRIETATTYLHARVDEGNYVGIGETASALTGLETERGIVAKASTWPWDPEALRVVLTALLVPLVLWLITWALGKFLS